LLGRTADDPQRPLDVLGLSLVQNLEGEVETVPRLFLDRVGDAEAARLSQVFEPCRQVDPAALVLSPSNTTSPRFAPMRKAMRSKRFSSNAALIRQT
jgi:hypothetical protein